MKGLDKTIQKDVRNALREDIGKQDISSCLLADNIISEGYIQTREDMILAGIPWVNEILQQVKYSGEWKNLYNDGDRIKADSKICEFKGDAKTLLKIERVILNFLQTLSATATICRRYADKIKGTKCRILDTRKTIPNLRGGQKYAVSVGGGYNHRMGLYDAILIKENHIKAMGDLTLATKKAKETFPNIMIEVEVENLQDFKKALNTQANRILLDNFAIDDIKKAVTMNKHKKELEVSGNINLQNITQISKSGVGFVSVGAITKNIQAIDLSMLFL
jgi:nicotinate-nucleotide pyrophosphorylase (carboxylating)